MSTLQGYFDESGKLSDPNPGIVAFAGCISTYDGWQSLSNRWNEIFDQVGIRSLHMKEVMSFRGDWRQFKDKEPERDDVLVELAKAVYKSSFFLLAAPMLSQEFLALPQAEQPRLKNLQYCGFETCVKGLSDSISTSITGPVKVQLICDLSEEYSSECLKLFIRLRRANKPLANLFPALTFGVDEGLLPLQVADMYAYCCRKHHIQRNGLDTMPAVISGLFDALHGGSGTEEGHMIYRAGKIDLGLGAIQREGTKGT